ncbi:MAG: tetratricopeptide repeat protein [Candidatus Obscuribacterales bacterium]|nr:tetratricopeptide repeat protein [Candidatus Obscuribacterales bacterium]
MNYKPTVLLFAWTSLIPAFALPPGERLWLDYRVKASVIYKKNQLQESANLLQNAIKIADEQKLSGEHKAIALSDLGTVVSAQGNLSKGEELQKEALALAKQNLWSGHPDVMRIQRRLYEVYIQERKYQEAESIVTSYLSEHTDDPLSNSGLIASMRLMANCNLYSGRHQDALQVNKELLALQRKWFPAKHFDIASTLNIMALSYRANKDWQNAESCYRQTIEELNKVRRPDQAKLADAFYYLAYCRAVQGDFNEAQSWYQKALLVYNELHGAASPQATTCLQSIAITYKDLEQYEKAEKLYQQVTNNCRQIYGNKSPELAEALRYHAQSLSRQKKWDSSISLYNQALHIYRLQKLTNTPAYIVSLKELSIVEKRGVSP